MAGIMPVHKPFDKGSEKAEYVSVHLMEAQMETKAITEMLREFLSALGFEAMARDVVSETEWSRIQHYARIVLKQAPADKKLALRSRFAMLRLV